MLLLTFGRSGLQRHGKQRLADAVVQFPCQPLALDQCSVALGRRVQRGVRDRDCGLVGQRGEERAILVVVGLPGTVVVLHDAEAAPSRVQRNDHHVVPGRGTKVRVKGLVQRVFEPSLPGIGNDGELLVLQSVPRRRSNPQAP